VTDGDLWAAVGSVTDERQAAALREASAWVGDRGVVAVGLGQSATGEPQIVVHTTDPDAELPAEVGGLPVQVEHSGPVQAYDVTRTDPESPQ
jgi:hypothetical protein